MRHWKPQAFLSQTGKCPFQRANSLVCFFLFVFSDFSHFLLLSSSCTDEYLYNVREKRSRQTDSTFIRSQLRSISLDHEKIVSFESNLSALTRQHHNNYNAALRKTLIEPTLIKQHMAAKPLCKKILPCPCHIHSVTHFVRGADPFHCKNKVLHSVALSAEAPNLGGLFKISLWVLYPEVGLKAQQSVTES